MLKHLLSLFVFSQFAMASTSDEPSLSELALIRKAIDQISEPRQIVKHFDCISIVEQNLPLDGLRCHHYAITKTLGLPSVPKTLSRHNDHEFLEKILSQFYIERDGLKDSKDGDLVVYFDTDEEITHVGIIRPENMVESKWGREDVILLHPILFLPSMYGSAIATYRAISSITSADFNTLCNNPVARHKERSSRKREKREPPPPETVAQRLLRILDPMPKYRKF